MPEKFLDRAYIVTASHQMCREGMAKRVTGNALGQTRPPDCGCYRFLHDGLMDMMASLLAGFGICPAVLLEKHPLPAPVLRHGGALTVKRVWKVNAARSLRPITISCPSSPSLIRIGVVDVIDASALTELMRKQHNRGRFSANA